MSTRILALVADEDGKESEKGFYLSSGDDWAANLVDLTETLKRRGRGIYSIENAGLWLEFHKRLCPSK